MVYKVDANGVESVLYTFKGLADGSYPYTGMILDSSGNLYGTTTAGGATGWGVVFKVDTGNNETVLNSLCSVSMCADGGAPTGGVVRDAAGNIYGTAVGGPTYNAGVIYEVDTTGQETVLYGFTGGADGGTPEAGVTLDGVGNLFGTTMYGGGSGCHGYGCGVVFELDTTGHETVLHAFTGGADGGNPQASAILDSNGNLCGATNTGGLGYGAIFKLDPTGHETVLHSFSSLPSCTDGMQPVGGVVFSSEGNLHGTTVLGGTSNYGVVFELPAPQVQKITFGALSDQTFGHHRNDRHGGLLHRSGHPGRQ